MTIFAPISAARPAPARLALMLGAAALALAGCTTGGGQGLDWDLRPGGISTAEAARAATAARPTPDARGVISYPGYQVAVAQRGDTVQTLAARVGVDAAELARYNAMQPANPLRAGELLALPRRVAETGAGTPVGSTPGAVVGAPIKPGAIDVTTIAATAIDRASPASAPAATAPVASTAAPNGWAKGPEAATQAPGIEPARHQVQRGETAYTIARSYGISARDLADWNGLDASLSVREGQYLLIPVPAAPAETPAAAPEAVTPPGAGSPTPLPPSAAEPLPAQDEPPAAAAAQSDPAAAAPDLGGNRSAASAGKLAMPVSGPVMRAYAKGKNDGIDISAGAGTPVVAAAAGTVAAITRNTEGVPIVVIRHEGNLLTVYGGIDALSVEKGATVTRGQPIAKVRAGDPSFLHFEVRQGFDSVDPMGYLQ